MRSRSEAQMRIFLEKNSTPITETGCSIWLSGVDKSGYGQTSFLGKNVRAHRLSYLLNVGPLNDGLVIMHTCDVPACINPRHLIQGTSQANTADRQKKGRHWVQSGDAHYMRRIPLCRSGEKCPSSKLTAADVLEIRRLIGDGLTQSAIAKQFSIARTNVSAIATGRNWANL